jgi:ferrochelatase
MKDQTEHAPSDRSPGFGVLISNLGSPTQPTARALRPYLREFLSDPRVVDMPRWRWWPILNLAILPFRPARSARLYRRVWTEEGSPLIVITRKIRGGLASRLADSFGWEVPVAVGMRYGSPSLADGLRELAQAGCGRILVMPLYPQYSATTTASTVDAVSDELRSWRRAPEIRTRGSYHDHPAYLEALAAKIRGFWTEHGEANRLMVSYHGLPRRYADAGDPYPSECARTTRELAKRLDLEPGRWYMSYQSRFGREPWLRPELAPRLERWGRLGIDAVDVVCPGFAADCLETLEEIAVSGREIFESAGGRGYRYIPALNDDPDHIEALARIVTEETMGWVD